MNRSVRTDELADRESDCREARDVSRPQPRSCSPAPASPTESAGQPGLSVQHLLIPAVIGAVGGLVGYAIGWFQHKQAETELGHIQSEDDHKRWVNVIKNLEDHVKELDGYDCVVCFENRRSVIFDCEHLVTCASCAAKLNVCPMCRATIRKRHEVKLFA